MRITDFLKDKVPFLTGMTEDQAQYLAEKSEQLQFGKNQTIIFKGVSVEGLHVIAQGKVSVHAKVEKKKSLVQVAEMGPGDVFGETSIFEFTMATATVKSEAEDTLIFVIPQEPFLKLLKTDPDLEKRTIDIIEKRKAAQAAKPKK